MFPICDGPSQEPQSPEKPMSLLDMVIIRLLFWTVKFEVTFVIGTLICSAWQMFGKVISCPCGSISYCWKTGLDPVLFEGLEITGVQIRLAFLPIIC